MKTSIKLFCSLFMFSALLNFSHQTKLTALSDQFKFSYGFFIDSGSTLALEKAIDAGYLSNQKLITFLRVLALYKLSFLGKIILAEREDGLKDFCRDFLRAFISPEEDEEALLVYKTAFLVTYAALKKLNTTEKGKRILETAGLHHFLDEVNLGTVNLIETLSHAAATTTNGIYTLLSKQKRE